MSERDRNGDSLWIPAHRDFGGISEDGGEVLFNLYFVDQGGQEVRRPPQLRKRFSQRPKSPETLRPPGSGHRKVIAGTVGRVLRM